MPGRLPNHGFREGSGEGSEPRVPGRFREGSGTDSGAVGDNTWAYNIYIYILYNNYF